MPAPFHEMLLEGDIVVELVRNARRPSVPAAALGALPSLLPATMVLPLLAGRPIPSSNQRSGGVAFNIRVQTLISTALLATGVNTADRLALDGFAAPFP